MEDNYIKVNLEENSRMDKNLEIMSTTWEIKIHKQTYEQPW